MKYLQKKIILLTSLFSLPFGSCQASSSQINNHLKGLKTEISGLELTESHIGQLLQPSPQNSLAPQSFTWDTLGTKSEQLIECVGATFRFSISEISSLENTSRDVRDKIKTFEKYLKEKNSKEESKEEEDDERQEDCQFATHQIIHLQNQKKTTLHQLEQQQAKTIFITKLIEELTSIRIHYLLRQEFLQTIQGPLKAKYAKTTLGSSKLSELQALAYQSVVHIARPLFVDSVNSEIFLRIRDQIHQELYPRRYHCFTWNSPWLSEVNHQKRIEVLNKQLKGIFDEMLMTKQRKEIGKIIQKRTTGKKDPEAIRRCQKLIKKYQEAVEKKIQNKLPELSESLVLFQEKMGGKEMGNLQIQSILYALQAKQKQKAKEIQTTQDSYEDARRRERSSEVVHCLTSTRKLYLYKKIRGTIENKLRQFISGLNALLELKERGEKNQTLIQQSEYYDLATLEQADYRINILLQVAREIDNTTRTIKVLQIQYKVLKEHIEKLEEQVQKELERERNQSILSDLVDFVTIPLRFSEIAENTKTACQDLVDRVKGECPEKILSLDYTVRAYTKQRAFLENLLQNTPSQAKKEKLGQEKQRTIRIIEAFKFDIRVIKKAKEDKPGILNKVSLYGQRTIRLTNKNALLNLILNPKSTKKERLEIIKHRVAFVKIYRKIIVKQIEDFKRTFNYVQMCHKRDGDEEEEKTQEEKQVQESFIKSLESLEKQASMESMRLQMDIDTLALKREEKILEKEESHNYDEFYTLFSHKINKNAYNCKSLKKEQAKLSKYQRRIVEKATQFEKNTTTIQKRFGDIIVKNTPALAKLISVRQQNLIGLQICCNIKISTLAIDLGKLERKIKEWLMLSKALSIGTSLVVKYGLTTLTTAIVMTATGPIGILLVIGSSVLIAGTQTATEKFVEDCIMNYGDCKGFKDDFCNRETIQSIIASGTTSGILTILPLAGQLKFPDFLVKTLKPVINNRLGEMTWKLANNSLVKEFSKNITQSTVGLLSDEASRALLMLHRDNAKKGLRETLLTIIKKGAFNALGTKMSNCLGSLYQGEMLDYLTHKGLHGLLGGTLAAGDRYIDGDEDLFSAFTSGAFGGITGEVISEAYFDLISKKKLKELRQRNHGLTREQFEEKWKEVLEREIEKSQLAGKLGTLGLAYATGQDVECAHFAATNAIDNNFAISTAIAFGFYAWTVYDIGCILLEAHKIHQKDGFDASRDYLLKQGCIEIVSKVLTKGTGKLIAKAVGAAGAVGFGLFLKKLGKKLGEKGGKTLEKKLIQKVVTKVATKGEKKLATTVGKKVTTKVGTKLATKAEKKLATRVGKKIRTEGKKKLATTVGKKVGAEGEQKLLNKAKSAYQIAKEGGNHARLCQEYLKKTTKELMKAVGSYQKQILKHQNKMKNPTRHIQECMREYKKKYGTRKAWNAWCKLPLKRQKAIVRKKWTSDIKRLKEQKNIMEAILKQKI